MKIAGYQGTTLIDWPGKIASVVFVPGCNFRCPFCHNADLVDPKRIKKIRLITEREILADLKNRRKWIDGVVITGGEPTLQPDLPQFLAKLKKLGFATMIETNASRPEAIRALLAQKLLNYVSLDIKGPLDSHYSRITNHELPASPAGGRVADVKKSLKLILKATLPFELRTTVVPGIHGEKVLLQMAGQLRRHATRHTAHVKFNWFLQTFQPKNCLNPKFNKLKPYSRMEMEKMLVAVRKIIPQAELR